MASDQQHADQCQCTPNSPAKGFENSLGLVVCIKAFQIINMQRDAGVINKALEKLPEQLSIKTANIGTGKLNIHIQPWTTGKINHNAGQRLVQRTICVTVAQNTFLIANG